MTTYNDDEPIVTSTDDSASDDGFVGGKVTATLINKTTAPLTRTDFNVMVKLTGSTGDGDSDSDSEGDDNKDSDRLPIDLVVVLDISGSMAGDKLNIMKAATEYLINKLGPLDRVSVVTFNHKAHRLCPLRQVNATSQLEIVHLVNDVHASGSTNITDGLQTGLKVLKDRRYTDDTRVDVIMLMSDGEQNDGGNAANVDVSSLQVDTFGFGTDHEPKVLKAIADNSDGGVFSDVQDVDNLSAAFAQCLGGLLFVKVQDLTLTVTSTVNSTIKKVDAGNYKQCVNGNSVTVSFGILYCEEVRNVVVTLDLPAVTPACGESTVVEEVLNVVYSYRNNNGEGDSPISAQVTRTAASCEAENAEVATEMCRIKFADNIKQARVLADGNHMEDAQKKLIEAGKVLADCNSNSSSINTMKLELQHLSGLMTSRQVYIKQGRSFALSFESSHDRQRFALRGDAEKLRMFAIPQMDKHFNAVKSLRH